MRLAMLKMNQDIAETLVSELRDRGYLIDVISEAGRFDGHTDTAALVPVPNESVPEFLRLTARYGGSVVSMANALMPPVDPGEYHSAVPVPAVEGGVSVYLFRISRYERIR